MLPLFNRWHLPHVLPPTCDWSSCIPSKRSTRSSAARCEPQVEESVSLCFWRAEHTGAPFCLAGAPGNRCGSNRPIFIYRIYTFHSSPADPAVSTLQPISASPSPQIFNILPNKASTRRNGGGSKVKRTSKSTTCSLHDPIPKLSPWLPSAALLPSITQNDTTKST